MKDWLWSAPDTWLMVGVSGIAIYLAVVLATRISGLRSFSKMSSFDFAITVAIGSLMATTLVSESPSLVQGMVGITVLYAIQAAVARLRVGSSPARHMLDNKPLLLMDGTEFLDENMRAARVTRDDLLAKLREANVLRRTQIHAVVLESTGDVSVLHDTGDGVELEPWLLEGVRRSPLPPAST